MKRTTWRINVVRFSTQQSHIITRCQACNKQILQPSTKSHVIILTEWSAHTVDSLLAVIGCPSVVLSIGHALCANSVYQQRGLTVRVALKKLPLRHAVAVTCGFPKPCPYNRLQTGCLSQLFQQYNCLCLLRRAITLITSIASPDQR